MTAQTVIQKIATQLSETDQKILHDEIVKLQAEAWSVRDREVGTYYEVGWDVRDDQTGEETWHSEFSTKNYSYASRTAYRWGCDYRIYRKNPYTEETTHV